jgi:hypothetical protein
LITQIKEHDYTDVRTSHKAIFKNSLSSSLVETLTPHPRPLPRGEREKRGKSPQRGEGKKGEVSPEGRGEKRGKSH